MSPLAVLALIVGTDKATPDLDKKVAKVLMEEVKDEELRLVAGGPRMVNDLRGPGLEQFGYYSDGSSLLHQTHG